MLEIILSVGLFALGAGLNELRHRKTTTRTEALLRKLPDAFVEKLEDERKRQLTIDELEELVMEVGYMTEWGIVPAECPRCGGPNVETFAVEGYDGDREAEMRCKDCGWPYESRAH